MSQGQLFINGLSRRTEAIFRRFCAINDLTFSQALDLLTHFMVSKDAIVLFGGKVSGFEQLDDQFREMMSKTPEAYRRFSVLQRYFGNLLMPLTRADIERIDEELAVKDESPIEIPEVDL